MFIDHFNLAIFKTDPSNRGNIWGYTQHISSQIVWLGQKHELFVSFRAAKVQQACKKVTLKRLSIAMEKPFQLSNWILSNGILSVMVYFDKWTQEVILPHTILHTSFANL